MRGTSFSKVVLLTSKVDTSAKISACFATEPMRLPASAIDAGMAGEAALGCLDAPNSSLKRIIRTAARSEEHTSELQSLMRISYAVFCLKKKKQHQTHSRKNNTT